MIDSTLTLPHIGLNAHLLSLSQNYRSAGISGYIYNLLQHLGGERASYRYTVFLHDQTFRPVNPLQLAYSPFPTYKPPARILWEQFFQPFALKQAQLDLYHAMAFVAPVMTPVPFVTTVYDLSFQHYPEAFRPFNRLYLNLFTRQSARRANAIIAISESTRQDVITYLHVEPEKVFTVYGGADDRFGILPQSQVDRFKAQHGLPDQFILYLGTIEPRKNVTRLIEAYAAWQKRDLEAPKLIIGGGKGWYYQQVFEHVQALNIADRVIFPGYIPNSDLPLWYNAATIFAYPSLFEGFGLPVLEAIACGTPTITSNTSSLPEVAGSAAILIDPTDVKALSLALEELFHNTDYRQSLREQGLQQCQKFSWEACAAQTNQVYERVLSG